MHGRALLSHSPARQIVILGHVVFGGGGGEKKGWQ